MVLIYLISTIFYVDIFLYQHIKNININVYVYQHCSCWDIFISTWWCWYILYQQYLMLIYFYINILNILMLTYMYINIVLVEISVYQHNDVDISYINNIECWYIFISTYVNKLMLMYMYINIYFLLRYIHINIIK